MRGCVGSMCPLCSPRHKIISNISIYITVGGPKPLNTTLKFRIKFYVKSLFVECL